MGVESALQSRSHEYGDEGGASSGSARRDASIPGGRLRRSRQEAGRFALWFAGTALLSRRSYRQTNVFPERECVSSRGSAKRKRPVRGKIWFRRGCGSLDISDCSLKGNASVAGGQRSAAPGVMEDLFPKRNASLDISDCSLKGNASVAGGQRSPRCDGGFVPKRNAGGWIFFGYQGAGFMGARANKG